jgi:tetratricopeptide (TPR) repeat protein
MSFANAGAAEAGPESIRTSLPGYSNSNFTDSAAPAEVERKGELQLLFNLGRRQRLQKNYVQASRNFALVLEREASEEMKRMAMLELALMSEEEGNLAKAQQVLANYVKMFAEDEDIPEIVLRQGLLYRRMGAPTLALSKFYSVMSSVLAVKVGSMERYRRLVLVAQTEIADTYYLDGRHAEAAEYFQRLLKLGESELDKGQIRYKLVRCLASQNQHGDTVAQAREYLLRQPAAGQRGEVSFLLATALKLQGKNGEALQQVLALLKEQQENRAEWAYWQQRTGNEIANHLYQEGDYVAALEIYNNLIGLDSAPAWRLPIWYQIGLVHERLSQPGKALETYQHIMGWQREFTEASPNLKTIMEMAKWRAEFLAWHAKTGETIQSSPVN